MSQAENVLKKIRKLESNMNCPNCNTPAQKGIGFGNVCVKFKTFVCDLCKTSHQAVSHRVKSVSMSTWTLAEVEELLDENGGGNQAARFVWLLNAPDFGGVYSGGRRPKPGDDIQCFKKFVVDCYEYGKFKADSPYIPQPVERKSASKTHPNRRVKSSKEQGKAIETDDFGRKSDISDSGSFFENSASDSDAWGALKTSQANTEVDIFGGAYVGVVNQEVPKSQTDFFGFNDPFQSSNFISSEQQPNSLPPADLFGFGDNGFSQFETVPKPNFVQSSTVPFISGNNFQPAWPEPLKQSSGLNSFSISSLPPPNMTGPQQIAPTPSFDPFSTLNSFPPKNSNAFNGGFVQPPQSLINSAATIHSTIPSNNSMLANSNMPQLSGPINSTIPNNSSTFAISNMSQMSGFSSVPSMSNGIGHFPQMQMGNNYCTGMGAPYQMNGGFLGSVPPSNAMNMSAQNTNRQTNDGFAAVSSIHGSNWTGAPKRESAFDFIGAEMKAALPK